MKLTMAMMMMMMMVIIIITLLFDSASAADCMSSDGTYHGKMNVSASGKPCFPWLSSKICFKGIDDVNLTSTHNFCRNPVEPAECHHERPLCYVDQGNNEWESCDLPTCGFEPPSACLGALGVGDGRIRDDQIFAPTQYNTDRRASYARLNSSNSYAWIASYNYPQFSYLSVNLTIPHTITKIALRGIPSYYITKFKVMYSADGYLWRFYGNEADDISKAREFEGNHGGNDVVVVYFENSFQALIIAIVPSAYYNLPSIQLEIYGCPSTNFDLRKTEITQNILSNTYWSLANSPYIIKTPILITTGATLTIEAGVKVVFADKTASLTVSGCLDARGIPGLEVQLLSNNILSYYTTIDYFDSSKPFWQGLIISSDLTGCNNGNFKNVYIRGAGITTNLKSINWEGLVIRNSPLAIKFTNNENVNLTNCLFKDNGNGIEIMRSQSINIQTSQFINHDVAIRIQSPATQSTQSSFSISDSTIRNNNYGIYKDSVYMPTKDNLQIVNCVFMNHQQKGVYLNPYYDNEATYYIESSTFKSSEVYVYAYSTRYSLKLFNSVFSDYKQQTAAVYVGQNVKTLLVQNCSFTNNLWKSIFVESGNYNANVTIANSKFTNNLQSSCLHIVLFNNDNINSMVKINSSIFFNNSVDEVITLNIPYQYDVTISNNQLINFNSPYEIASYSPYSRGYIYNADSNYWGTTDAKNIANRILDFYKDASRSVVQVASIFRNETMNSLIVTNSFEDWFIFNGTIGGFVNGNTIMSSSSEISEYNVTRSIYVSNGSCLTILGSLTLKFKPKTGIVVEGGCLIVTGNVTFISSDKTSNFENYRWNGIRIINSNNSIFNNVYMYDTILPIENVNSSVKIQSSTFSNVRFLKASGSNPIDISLDNLTVNCNERCLELVQTNNISVAITNSNLNSQYENIYTDSIKNLNVKLITCSIVSIYSTSINIGSGVQSGKVFVQNSTITNRIIIYNSGVEHTFDNSVFISSSDCISHYDYYNNKELTLTITNCSFSCVQICLNFETRYSGMNNVVKITDNKISSGYITITVRNPKLIDISRNVLTSKLAYSYVNLVGIILMDSYNLFDVTRNGAVKIEGNIFQNVSRVADSSVLKLICSYYGYYYKNVIYMRNNIFRGNDVTGVVSTDCSGLTSDRNILNNPKSDYEFRIVPAIKSQWPASVYFARNFWGNVSDPNLRVLDESNDQTLVKAVINPWFENENMTTLVTKTSTFFKGNGQIGGTLQEDVVLTATGSPYVVTEDIFIPADKKLTIEPSVKVIFLSGGITVEGTLISIGNETNKIELNSKSNSSQWKGIKFQRKNSDWVVKKDKNWWSIFYKNAWYVVDMYMYDNSNKKMTADLLCQQAGYKESVSQTVFNCNSFTDAEKALIPPCTNNTGPYQRVQLQCSDPNAFSVQECSVSPNQYTTQFYNISCLERLPVGNEKYVKVTAKSGKRLTATPNDDVILDSQVADDNDVFVQVTPCLLGTDPNCFSLMSLKKPGWFLRKDGEKLIVDPKNCPRRPDDFNGDASFISLPSFNPSDTSYSSLKVLSSPSPAWAIIFKENGTSSLSLVSMGDATNSSSQSAFSFKIDLWNGPVSKRKKRSVAGQSILDNVRIINPNIGISVQGQLPILKNIEILNSTSHSLQISGVFIGNFTIDNFLSMDSGGSGMIFALTDFSNDFICSIYNSSFVNNNDASVKWTGQGTLKIENSNFLQFTAYAIYMTSSGVQSKPSKAVIKFSQFKAKLCRNVLYFQGRGNQYFQVLLENNDFIELTEYNNYDYNMIKLINLVGIVKNNRIVNSSYSYVIVASNCYELNVTGNIIKDNIVQSVVYSEIVLNTTITDNLFSGNKAKWNGQAQSIYFYSYLQDYNFSISNNSFFNPDIQYEVYFQPTWDRFNGAITRMYDISNNKWLQTNWSTILERINCFYNSPSLYPVNIWPSISVVNGSESIINKPVAGVNSSQEIDFIGGEIPYSMVINNNTKGFFTMQHSIYIPPNVTLTLNGGVVLKFTSGSSLAVDGNLIINASVNAPVRLADMASFSMLGNEINLNGLEIVNVLNYAIMSANIVSLSNLKVDIMQQEFKIIGDVINIENCTFSRLKSAVHLLRGNNLNNLVENKVAVKNNLFVDSESGITTSSGFDKVDITNCSFNRMYYIALLIQNNQYKTNSSFKISTCTFVDNGLSIDSSGNVRSNVEVSRSTFSETSLASHYTGYGVSGIRFYLDNGENVIIQENIFQRLPATSVLLSRQWSGSTKKLNVWLLDNIFANSTDSTTVVLENFMGVEANVLRNKFMSNFADTSKNYDKVSLSYTYSYSFIFSYNWPTIQSSISQNRFEKNGGKYVFEFLSSFSDYEQQYIDMFNRTSSKFDVSSNVFIDNFPSDGVISSNIPIANFSFNILGNPVTKYDFVAKFKPAFSQNCTYNWWGSNDRTMIKNRLRDITQDSTVGRILYEPFLNESKFSCSGVQSCSGNGLCVAPDVCQCNSGWTGLNCSKYSCARVYDCLGRGECIGPDKCNCTGGWWGDDCSRANCNLRNNCSNRGVCSGPNQCLCASQFSGLDCSECRDGWWGSSCAPCPSCVHGTCNKITGKCDCSGPNFIGLLCDQCAPKYFGALCLPLVRLFSILTDYGPDLGGTEIFISGNNLPNVTSYKCRFDGNLEVDGMWKSEDKISCTSPRREAGVVTLEVKISDAQGYLDTKFYFTYNPACPVSACGSTATPKRGVCSMGKCSCFVPWTGNDCDQLGLAPEISTVKNTPLIEGQNFILQLNITQGTPLFRWLLISSPNGVNLDESSGLLTWTKVPASTQPYSFKIECSNKFGKGVLNFDLSVPPSYELILDPLPKGPFIRPQSTLISGKVSWIGGVVNDYLKNAELPLVLLINSNSGLRKIPLAATPMTQRGLFYTRFQPSNSEVGLTQLDARHPCDVGATLTNVQQSWKVYGLNMIVTPSSVSEYIGQYNYQNFLVVNNNALDPLTNLVIMMYTPPFDFTLYSNVTSPSQVLCKWSPSTSSSQSISNCTIVAFLKANESLVLNANITADKGYSGSFPITLATKEGVMDQEMFSFSFQQKFPVFKLSRNYIETTVSRGKVQFEQIELTNVGARAATNVKPQFPSSSLLNFVSFGTNETTLNNVLQPGIVLEPGQSSTLLFSFNPSLNESIGDIQGSASIVSTETGVTFSFRFIITSTDRLNLTIKVEDEYTYFSEDKPLLAGAKVALTSKYTGLTVTQFTDTTGIAKFMNILEDYYTIQTSADKHLPDSRIVFATQGQTVISVFLQRTAVSYSWVVKPVPFEDRYDITLEADFTTNVPAPVVTMEPTQIDLDLMERGLLTTLQFKVTNHGLIAARGFQFTLPDVDAHPFLTLTMGNTDIGDIPANTTLYVIVDVHTDEAKKLQYMGTGVAKRSVNKRSSIGKCLSMLMKALYYYICDKKRYNELMATIDNSKVCDANVPSGKPLNLVFRPWLAPAFGWGSGSDLTKGTTVVSPINCKCDINYPWTCWTAYKTVVNCVKIFYSPNKLAIGYYVVQCVRKLESIVKCAKLIIDCQFGNGNRGGTAGGSPKRRKRSITLSKEDMGLMMGERSMAVQEYYNLGSTYLGDDEWFYLTEPPTKWWPEVFEPAFSETSEGGSIVTKNEYDAIMKSPLPSNATLDMVRKLVLRYNSSFADWGNGGEGLGEGMISLAKVQASEAKLKAYEDEAKKANKNSIADWYNEAYDTFDQAQSNPEEGVCAKVRIQIQQRMTLTRTGFEAQLQLENGETSDLTNIKVVLVITTYGTSNSTDAIYKFAIGKPRIVGMTDVSGNGTLVKGTKGTATWLIIPYSSAAPTADVQYNVGGTLYYSIGNETLTVPLFPDTITVKPDPRLFINYFLEKYVYSDDPFTPNVVEPAVPFILGILITNSGYGPATDLKITSSQPKIIDNEKGLLVDFKIVGTRVAGTDISPSLTINFGDIAPKSSKSADWIMTCSLSGTFSNFSATFQNTNPLGDSRLSVLEEVNFHELLHTVLIDYPSSDSLVDYLIIDPFMTLDLVPIQVYDSSDGIHPLNVSVCNVTSEGLVVSGKMLKLTAVCEKSGWVYTRTLFPSTLNAQQTIATATRTDGKQLNVNHNVWLQQIKKKNYLQVFDYVASPGTYVYNMYSTLINLHPPTFVNDVIQVNITENLNPPFVVVVVNATDEDGDGITYSLLTQQEQLPFAIDSKTGIITTTKQLDREQRDQYSLVVIATDSGNPPKTGTLVIAVNVTDVNDNSPKFYGLPDFLSFEDITPADAILLKNVIVKDDDIGVNALLTIQLLHPNNQDLLVYDSNNQTIKSKLPFSNHVGVYNFSMVATDQGNPPLTTVANFTLKIVKLNRFKPAFNKTFYSFDVNETNSIGSFIGKVSAWDEDDVNEKITFTIDASSSSSTIPFALDPSTGILTNIFPLVATSENTTFRFKVVATDNGAPPTGQLSNSVDLVVNILDMNDHPPKFPQPFYEVTVKEDAPVNTELFNVQATDSDYGLNSVIKNFTFNVLLPSNIIANNYFKLESDIPNKKVKLLSAGLFDRETIDNFVIELKVVDSGTPPLESTSNVTIIVSDVNDCVPRFNITDVNVTVSRRTPVNSVLFTFKAEDCDLNPQLVYTVVFPSSIPSMDPLDFISLNKDTGVIRLIKSLSTNMTIKSLQLTSQASDGLHTSSNNQKLNLLISDVNVYPPIFKQRAFQTSINETDPVGSILNIDITCTDEDSTTLYYNIAAGNEDNVFAVDIFTGKLTLAKPLNYEAKSSYNLTIVTYDDLDPKMALNSTAIVVVKVLNVNEFPPTFINAIGLTLKLTRGQLVPKFYQFIARDDDGDNVTFTLLPSVESNYFTLDPLTGWLSVVKIFDQSQVMIQVKATDNGVPSLSAVVDVIIAVNNVSATTARLTTITSITPLTSTTQKITTTRLNGQPTTAKTTARVTTIAYTTTTIQLNSASRNFHFFKTIMECLIILVVRKILLV